MSHHFSSPLGWAAVMVTIVFAAPVLGVEVVVDNTDTSFQILQGTWGTSTGTQMYGTNFRVHGTSSTATSEVEWRPVLPQAGSYRVSVWYPSGTSRPSNAGYVVHHNGGTTSHSVDQRSSGGQWVVLATYNFAAGTAGSVSLTDKAQVGKTLAADAVRFELVSQVEMTMAVSPAGAGTTTPSAGTYWKTTSEVVSISAAPATGYAFSHWAVSAGAEVADPSSAATTVVMEVPKTVTAVFTAAPQFRALWVDVFHSGLQSAGQVDEMIGYAVAGRYNAILVEMLAYHDNPVGSHGAYWQSDIAARSSYVTTSFDPLGYIVQRAHANGIEVHPWVVAYRASGAWPPAGNAILTAHPEWLMVPRAGIGTVTAVNGTYTLDPGSPEVQDYLVSLVREVATKYAVDGFHWDYIRYTQTDAGYPSDNNYANSGLARFRRLTGRTDVPAADDVAWNAFRRQSISELMRRVRAELPTIANPRQPLRHTASLIPWGDAPSDFSASSAYALFQDWELWMRMGWLDAGCPMLYYREHCTEQAAWYRNWVNAALNWRYGRHMYLGQGNYMNGMANSITEMTYAYGQGAEGSVNYAYYSTRATETLCDGADPTINDFSWYPYVAANLFTAVAPTPVMPWRYPSTAVEGTLFGQVIDAMTGTPLDDVTVQVGAQTIKTDGNGYYTATLLPAVEAGTGYDVAASKAGYPSALAQGVLVKAGLVARQDMQLGVFVDCNQNGLSDVCDLSCATAGCNMAGCGQASDCDGNGVPDSCDADADADGVPNSCDNCATTPNPSQADGDVDNVGDACDQCSNTLAGLPVDADGCSAYVPGDIDRDGDVDVTDFGMFAGCLAGSGVAVTQECASRNFDGDDDVDQADFGLLQRCYSGTSVAADAACALQP